MKSIKLVLLVVVTMAFSQIAIGQSKEERAKANTEKYNEKIVSKNKDLALSEDQKTKITAIYLEQIMEIDALKKEVADEEARKAKNQEVYKKQGKKNFDEVLTSDQKNILTPQGK
jgi:protein CpxP